MKKVVIGLSGGVDSSVAACLLKEQGYHVVGVTLHMFEHENEDKSCLKKLYPDAAAIAGTLGIEYLVEDVSGDFEQNVIRYFISEYMHGRTPNPCNICNPSVKFHHLLKIADRLGADYIATGHYARIEQTKEGVYTVRNADFAPKDQTYALCRLSSAQLARVIMPLGAYSKEEVRAMAEERKLPVAAKKDSQDICFIPDGDYCGFLERTIQSTDNGLPNVKGNFIKKDGTVIGPHKGIYSYTYGQRRGLGIPAGERLFVTEIDPSTGNITLGSNSDLFAHRIVIERLQWIEEPETIDENGRIQNRYLGRVRYGHKGTEAVVTMLGVDKAEVYFEEPVRAATPGQFCVLYTDGRVAGSGIIAGGNK